MAENQRMHVLDWQRRMSSYSFSDPPAGVIPRRQVKRIKVVVASQVKATGLLGEHTGTFHAGMNPNNTRASASASARACAINCAAPAKDFAGEKVFDGERSWRTACAQ